MNITRSCLILVLALTFAASGSAQESRCNLKLVQAPTLRGLRLGMSAAQVREVFPNILIPPADERGFASTDTTSGSGASEAIAKGIQFISLRFLDNRLVGFTVKYDDSVQWDSPVRFTTKVAESLRLPNLWSTDNSDSKLTCDGFEVKAYSGNGGAITMRETTGWEAAMQKRAKVIRERKQQAFKP